jgi:hypothetical protein
MTIPPIGAALPPPPSATATAPRPGFGAVLEARSAQLQRGAGSSNPAHPAAAALDRIERAQARLDAVLAAARAGRTFTAAELIGLQAETYRCAQTIDLASKLAEQGAQSVKQALNTQL